VKERERQEARPTSSPRGPYVDHADACARPCNHSAVRKGIDRTTTAGTYLGLEVSAHILHPDEEKASLPYCSMRAVYTEGIT
jgi:hypothetical protein